MKATIRWLRGDAFFHVGAPAMTRNYRAGAITGALVYVPLTVQLVSFALQEALIPVPWLVAAFVVALPFHVLELGHSAFKRR